MNLRKRDNVRMCAAVGAAAGAGPVGFSSIEASYGWPAAVVVCALISVAAAMVASLAVRALVRADLNP